jgi:hypothetical protein
VMLPDWVHLVHHCVTPCCISGLTLSVSLQRPCGAAASCPVGTACQAGSLTAVALPCAAEVFWRACHQQTF